MVAQNLKWKASSPTYVDRIGLWVYYSKIPIYTTFYLRKGDYKLRGLRFGVPGSIFRTGLNGKLNGQETWRMTWKLGLYR